MQTMMNKEDQYTILHPLFSRSLLAWRSSYGAPIVLWKAPLPSHAILGCRRC